MLLKPTLSRFEHATYSAPERQVVWHFYFFQVRACVKTVGVGESVTLDFSFLRWVQELVGALA